MMPGSKVVLPREKPCPKDKPKTKWEKFREERGMAPRAKRSRLVFDELTQDWVPRWGPNSVKKIADKHQWAMVEKPKHREAGVDPFTYAKAEKRAKIEKQNLRSLKNKMHATAEGGKKDVKILAANPSAASPSSAGNPSMKLKEDRVK